MNNLHLKAAGERAESTNDLIDMDKELQYGKGDSALRVSLRTDGAHLQWRDIEEGLPERNVAVLVCFKSGYDKSLIRAMAYRTFDPGSCCWSTNLVYEEPDGYSPDDIEVTHWMPLPDLPV
jgi:hypothetical protein